MPFRTLGLAFALLIAFVGAPTAHANQTRIPRRHVKKATRPFIATAYCRGRTTATGDHVHDGLAAADPDVIPLGTLIRVSDAHRRRIGTYRVMDTGRRIQGRRVDLFIESCARAKRFGRKPVHVTIVSQ